MRDGHQPVHPRLAGSHRRDEDPGAQAGAGPVWLRRGVRRRPPRRGALAGQGAGLFLPRPQPSLGSRRTSAPNCGICTTAACTRARASGCFPLSNWTELDVWQYIHLEQIPIVPLYFAAERPVVERDGTLIMVDDDRMPLVPGEIAENGMGPLSHPGLLPADRRDPLARRLPCRKSFRKCC